jgi:hypothetical protein
MEFGKFFAGVQVSVARVAKSDQVEKLLRPEPLVATGQCVFRVAEMVDTIRASNTAPFAKSSGSLEDSAAFLGPGRGLKIDVVKRPPATALNVALHEVHQSTALIATTGDRFWVHLQIGQAEDTLQRFAHKILNPKLNLLLGSTVSSNPEPLTAWTPETEMRTVTQKE